jgi:S-adenosylmethionine:tRNA ribosyltransferase-isomerase
MIRAARAPRAEEPKLLVIDPEQRRFLDARMGAFFDFFAPGDLLVVNDAATFPASFMTTSPAGHPLEVRLAGFRGGRRFFAALLGRGDWRTPTEKRPDPDPLEPGDRIELAPGLSARVIEQDWAASPRLIELELDREGERMWGAIYASGRPVQYSYLASDLALEAVQTAYAARPWAAEMPSAGRPLSAGALLAAKARGVEVRALTHAAGLSSIGDASLDALLPLPERFEIPEPTAEAIEVARAKKSRVIAVGTTVVRAIEGSIELGGGKMVLEGETTLRIGPGFVPKRVDGILTGMHEPEASHFALLLAFAPRDLLLRAHSHAVESGYLAHEFGDACLILPNAFPRTRARETPKIDR